MSVRGAPVPHQGQQRQTGTKMAAAAPQKEFVEPFEELAEGEPVSIFDLTELVSNLQGDPNNLGSQERVFHMTLVKSLAELKTDGGVMGCDSTVFMRSAATRTDVDFTAGPIENVPRKSEVDKILIEEATMLHRANNSEIEVGIRMDGIRGRSYTTAGDKGRFADVLPITCSAPDNFRIHLPTLTGLQVMAAAFSTYDEKALEEEYANIPSKPGWVNLKYSADCKTLAHFFESADEDLYEQYGVNPQRIRFNDVKTGDGTVRLLPLPRKLIHDLHENMFRSKEQLNHFNPTTSGVKYQIEFLPTHPDVDSWANIDNHPVVKWWISQGPEVYHREMNRPYTFTCKALIKFIADDPFTRDLINERLNNLPALVPQKVTVEDME